MTNNHRQSGLIKFRWWKSEIKVSTGLIFLEASVLGLLMAIFSLCLHGSLAGESDTTNLGTKQQQQVHAKHVAWGSSEDGQ